MNELFEKKITLDQSFPVKCELRWHWFWKTAFPAFACMNGHIFAGKFIKDPEVSPDGEFITEEMPCPLCEASRTWRIAVPVTSEEKL